MTQGETGNRVDQRREAAPTGERRPRLDPDAPRTDGGELSTRADRAGAIAWLIGAGSTGYAVGRVAVERPDLAGSLVAVALVLAVLGALHLSREARDGAPPHATLAGALAALSIAFLAVLGPVATSEAPEKPPTGAPWPLPNDAALAAEALRLRAELRAAGSTDEELRRVLEAMVEEERRESERRAAEQAAEAEREREKALAADRARRAREAEADDLRALINGDLAFVIAGRADSVDAGPLADRERWRLAERRLSALDVRAGRLDATRDERERVLETLLDTLDARQEGLGGELGATIAALESRLASTARP